MLRDRFAARLSAFYVGHFIALGIQMPFLPVWLAAKGLDADAIGLVLAAPLLVRMVTISAATAAADRWDALRGTLVAVAIITPLAYVAVGLANGFWPILVAVAIASAAFTTLFPLSDAYALKGLAARGRPYGPIRLWGSAAFIVGSLGAGAAAELIAPLDFIWLITAAAFLTAFTALALPALGPMPAARTADGSGAKFLASPIFLLVTGSASLIQASHAVYYGFSTLAWTAAGLDGRVIGILWALAVLAEVVLFGLSGRFLQSLSALALIGIGAAGAVARWSLMALDPSAPALAPVQCLHALSFAATHLGSMLFLTRAAPGGRSATVQGCFTLVVGAVMAGAMALSGRLYEAYGTRAYAAMAVAALAGGILALAAHRLRGREQAA
jgi:PPP family 3-phenylpropionic acid transporter